MYENLFECHFFFFFPQRRCVNGLAQAVCCMSDDRTRIFEKKMLMLFLYSTLTEVRREKQVSAKSMRSMGHI